MKKIQLCFLGFVITTSCFCQRKDFIITNYGAVRGGIISNTRAIQNAIDDANKNGGGKVVVPAGKFLTGVIHLKSNVELYVEKDAELLASTNSADYGPSGQASAWIVADNAKNISISGKGTIDGQCDLLIQGHLQKISRGGTVR